MATRPELSSITKGEYMQYLATKPEITNHQLLHALATPNALSWDVIKQIIDSGVVPTLERRLRQYVELVLDAKALEALLDAEQIDGGQSKIVLDALKYVRIGVPDIDLRDVILAIVGYLTAGALEATDGLDLNNYYATLNYIEAENLYGDLTTIKVNLHDRYLYVLSTGSTDTSLPAVKKQLYVFVGMKQHGVSMDYTVLKQITINIALMQVAYSDTSAEDRQELLRLLMELNEEEFRQTVAELAREYGVDQNAPLHHQEIRIDPIPPPPHENPRASSDNPPEVPVPNLPVAQGFIQSSSQVQLEQHPKTANTKGDPHVYVYEATFVYDGRTYPAIVKQFVSANEEKVKKNGLNEGKILAHLSQTNTNYFLQYYGSYLEAQPGGKYCYSVVMEKCRGDLMEDFSKRTNPKQPYAEDHITFIVRSLLEAFAIMGAKKIYHCDVKPHNILVSNDNTLKICDFNIGNMLEEAHRFTSAPTGLVELQGTDGYMAPEIQAAYDLKKEGKQTPPIHTRYGRIDCYGLGLVFLQAATLRSVEGLNKAQNQDLVESYIGEVQIAWLRDLLRSMLKFNYRERKSIKTLVAQLTRASTTAQQ